MVIITWLPKKVVATHIMTVAKQDSINIHLGYDDKLWDEYATLDPAITVEPESFDVELYVDTQLDTTMTISNLGFGTLDFTIEIGGDIRFVKSDAGEKINKDAGIGNLYGEFTVSSILEGPVSFTHLSASSEPSVDEPLLSEIKKRDFTGQVKRVCLPAVPIPSGLWKAGQTYRPTVEDTIPNYQPSTINHQPSTINYQLSTINHQLSYRPAEEDTIHYDVETCSWAFGGTPFEGAIRLTPTELAPYNGWDLISVLFYYYTGGDIGTVKIYGQGTPYSPGRLITSEPFLVSEQSWWRIDLSSPVSIDASQNIWVSVTIPHIPWEEFPLGLDSGPAVDGKGDFYYGGEWIELQNIGLDYNWNIRAIVAPPEYEWLSVTPDSGTVPPGQEVDITVHFETYGLTPDSTYTTNILIHNNSVDSLVTIPVTMHVTSVGVEDDAPQVPKVFALRQNYPNPFSTSTTISFSATDLHGLPLINIYNIRGQLVKTLIPMTNDKCPMTSIVWDGKDENGKQLSSGIYFYRITAGDFTDTKKCVILK